MNKRLDNGRGDILFIEKKNNIVRASLFIGPFSKIKYYGPFSSVNIAVRIFKSKGFKVVNSY